MKVTRPRLLLAVAALGVLALAAWQRPHPSIDGGACNATTGARAPLTFSVTNAEQGRDGSPLHLEDVTVSPANFTHTAFTPAAIVYGASATMTVDAPVGYSGPVTVTAQPHWFGTDGSDASQAPLVMTVQLGECPQPTTTTVTVTSTTTTIVVTTTGPTQPPTTPTTECVNVGGQVSCATTTTVHQTVPPTTAGIPSSSTTVAPPLSQVAPPSPPSTGFAISATPAFTG